LILIEQNPTLGPLILSRILVRQVFPQAVIFYQLHGAGGTKLDDGDLNENEQTQ
jgi:hypothetical protein